MRRSRTETEEPRRIEASSRSRREMHAPPSRRNCSSTPSPVVSVTLSPPRGLLFRATTSPPVSRRTAPRRTAPHRTVPYRTAPHRAAPHRTAPHRTAPRRAGSRHRQASRRRACLLFGQRSRHAIIVAKTHRVRAFFRTVVESSAIDCDSRAPSHLVISRLMSPRRSGRSLFFRDVVASRGETTSVFFFNCDNYFARKERRGWFCSLTRFIRIRGTRLYYSDAVISDRLNKRKLWQRGVACCMRATPYIRVTAMVTRPNSRAARGW